MKNCEQNITTYKNQEFVSAELPTRLNFSPVICELWNLVGMPEFLRQFSAMLEASATTAMLTKATAAV
jgi:hypothetical protein